MTDHRPLNLGAEERVLAGRLGGALWLTALPMAVLALALPDVPGRHPVPALALAGVATLWGLLASFVIPWDQASARTFYVITAVSVPAMATSVAFTGGGPSPLWPGFALVVAYCAYFYPFGPAVAFAAACGIALALPYLYAPASVEPSFLGEVLVAAASYFTVAGIVMLGKRQVIKLRDAAEYLAMHDPLTELPNRRVLRYELEKRLARRGEQTVALFLLDLDNFKDINTVYGHPGGDIILCTVAKALKRAVRIEDTVARLGGDEFAVLVTAYDQDQLRAVPARLINTVLNEPLPDDLEGLAVGASVGWARHPHDAIEIDDLIAAADLSLRAAKSLGKGIAQSPQDWADLARGSGFSTPASR